MTPPSGPKEVRRLPQGRVLTAGLAEGCRTYWPTLTRYWKTHTVTERNSPIVNHSPDVREHTRSCAGGLSDIRAVPFRNCSATHSQYQVSACLTHYARYAHATWML